MSDGEYVSQEDCESNTMNNIFPEHFNKKIVPGEKQCWDSPVVHCKKSACTARAGKDRKKR